METQGRYDLHKPRRHADDGQTSVEYLGLIVVAALVVAACVGTPLGRQVLEGVETQVCRIVGQDERTACQGSDVAGTAADDGEKPEEPPEAPTDDPFQPAVCMLSEEQTKDTVVVQITFFKMSDTEELKIQQWSDGTVTMQHIETDTVGATTSISAGIPGLKDWGGGASLNASYGTGGGVGGQWLFDGHKTGDTQADLAANLEDAEAFAAALKQNDTCNAMPNLVNPVSVVGCRNSAMERMKKENPQRLPDVDITKTTTELAGGVSFGKSFKSGGKKGKGDKGGDAPASLGSVSTELLSGSMTNDVLVMRANSGPNAGTVTFIYTLSVNAKGGQGVQARGTRMQQVAVTYDAAQYDEEEKNDEAHHPTKLQITTSSEEGTSKGVQAGAGANVGPTPITIEVGGGGGEIESEVHTETAEVTLDDEEDSRLVEDWLRGRGDFPASDALPTPTEAAEPLTGDAGSLERLLHDKAKLSQIDYQADTDWWNVSVGVGLGVSAGALSMGFKLFGLDITHEEREQTVINEPTYATGPAPDGSRPWLEWTNCTQTTPIA
ncbi:hypothetical protein ACWC10_06030 [Streptomyces sp. NPDC001595]|uniref:hypothetical protein n=1 Tax=Streptomyces sp. NPDC001532 TaxID=3154520 RepID=UPI003326EA0A